MATPRLTSDGTMHWPPRDWIESLCARQPDGTWLVQAPPLRGREPQLHLLPDDRGKDAYVARATRLLWAEVAINLAFTPPVFLSVFLMGIVGELLLVFGDGSFWPVYIMALVGVMLGLALIVQAHLTGRLADWLKEVAVALGDGTTATPFPVRTEREWQAVVLSNGLRGEGIVALAMIGLTIPVMAAYSAAYLNICRGVAMLDPLFPERAREQARAWSYCPVDGTTLVFKMAAVVIVVALHLVIMRRRRAGRARPMAV
jgi:hypothetical protein